VRREIEAASSKQAESAPKAEENSIEIVDVSKDSADGRRILSVPTSAADVSTFLFWREQEEQKWREEVNTVEQQTTNRRGGSLFDHDVDHVVDDADVDTSTHCIAPRTAAVLDAMIDGS